MNVCEDDSWKQKSNGFRMLPFLMSVMAKLYIRQCYNQLIFSIFCFINFQRWNIWSFKLKRWEYNHITCHIREKYKGIETTKTIKSFTNTDRRTERSINSLYFINVIRKITLFCIPNCLIVYFPQIYFLNNFYQIIKRFHSVSFS